MTMFTDRMANGSLGKYRHLSQPSLWAAAGAVVGNLVMTLLDWQERARQRRRARPAGRVGAGSVGQRGPASEAQVRVAGHAALGVH